MSGLYLFAGAVGVPLALWFVVSGGDEGPDAAADGIGGLMFRLLPLSSITIAAAAFGLTGLLVGATGLDDGFTLFLAAAAGIGAGVLNSVVFTYLRRTDSAAVDDRHLSGAMGRVVLPITADQRGRVVVTVGSEQRYLSARVAPGAAEALEVGAPILVVQVDAGIAVVTRLDPELT